MVDGRLVCACLVLGAEMQDREVETIENMAEGDNLHPLQQKFLEHAALQCGICTPGFLVASKALLEKNPDPTETEIRFGCRKPVPLQGYDKIVRAVKDTAAEMKRLICQMTFASPVSEKSAPSGSLGRVDKVTGRANLVRISIYLTNWSGRSSAALTPAIIKSIDTSKAKALKGVKAVICRTNLRICPLNWPRPAK